MLHKRKSNSKNKQLERVKLNLNLTGQEVERNRQRRRRIEERRREREPRRWKNPWKSPELPPAALLRRLPTSSLHRKITVTFGFARWKEEEKMEPNGLFAYWAPNKSGPLKSPIISVLFLRRTASSSLPSNGLTRNSINIWFEFRKMIAHFTSNRNRKFKMNVFWNFVFGR